MNYKKVLEKLGLIENVDFALTAESFEMLPKQVEVEISHAVLDEEGNVVSPAVTEMQSFTPAAPSVEVLEATWNEILVDEFEIQELIEKYLEDKAPLRDPENDSINIVNNRIYSWGFVNIPAPTLGDLAVITTNYKQEKIKKDRIANKILIGQITDKACNDAFTYIQGANIDRNMTSAQKTEMATLFAPALQAIQVKRPGQLKAYIASITPDEVLITTEMKEDLLEILKAF